MSDYYPETLDAMPLFAAKQAPAVQHSRTSMAAADSLTPERMNALQRAVYALLASEPEGLTDEQIQARLGMNPSTERPRRIELARRGLVIEAGTRKTTSGRMASVWKAMAASS